MRRDNAQRVTALLKGLDTHCIRCCFGEQDSSYPISSPHLSLSLSLSFCLSLSLSLSFCLSLSLSLSLFFPSSPHLSLSLSLFFPSSPHLSLSVSLSLSL